MRGSHPHSNFGLQDLGTRPKPRLKTIPRYERTFQSCNQGRIPIRSTTGLDLTSASSASGLQRAASPYATAVWCSDKVCDTKARFRRRPLRPFSAAAFDGLIAELESRICAGVGAKFLIWKGLIASITRWPGRGPIAAWRKQFAPAHQFVVHLMSGRWVSGASGIPLNAGHSRNAAAYNNLTPASAFSYLL